MYYLIDNSLIELDYIGNFSIKTNIYNNGENAIEIREDCSPYDDIDWFTTVRLYSKKQIRCFNYIIE